MRGQRRRRAPRKSLVNVPRNKLAFPQGIRTTLRFCKKQDFVLTNATTLHYQFLANGLYDPVVAVGGAQPRGFDQFMAAYDTFTCHGSKISVNFMFQGYSGPSIAQVTSGNLLQGTNAIDVTAPVAAQPPVMCGIRKGTQAMDAGNAEYQMEGDNTVWKVIAPTEGGKVCRMQLDVAKFTGKKQLIGSEGWTGSATADPTELLYYSVWCCKTHQPAVGPLPTTNLFGYVTIEYDVTFSDPKILTAS